MESEVSSFFESVDPARAADEYLRVCELAAGSGYRHYEVSNFARRGFESAHNRVYWSGGEYLGVGPGAHSFIGARRFHNEPSLERYLASKGRRVCDRYDEEAAGLERMMLGLRTDEGVLLSRLPCGEDAVEDLVGAGLATIAGERLVLTDRGYLVMNDVVLRLYREPYHAE
jgi:oxygen-independent coproporphyrinogen-3 oxidase